ncbi:MAG: glycoside hydrolase family 2 protein [Bacteroidota bacterium]
MKKILIALTLVCSFSLFTSAQTSEWKMVAGHIASPWSEKVDDANPLPEYPRPQLVRENWLNLNGLWDFTIQPKDEKTPATFQGKILVPFAAESSLSGVSKIVGKDNRLWYRRSVIIPSTFSNKNVLLHFGAVDWQCEVFVNGQKAGEHQGGYDPFFLDITTLLKKRGDQQEIVVAVWDPSDAGPQPRGKQVNNPHSIWYTPVTGIWQTVWLEPVPQTYIQSVKNIPDIDEQTLTVKAMVNNLQPGDRFKVSIWANKQMVSEQETDGTEAILPVKDAKLWSPANPFLYDLKIAVVRKGKIVDEATSYFGMRKISVAPDSKGFQRMLLNNEFVFQYGPLDQGWWPDGLYTAPTDEALKFDIEKTKEMGFNMIRKHVKVEPARWYYHCDKLGMLVWQDMPSGDLGNRWESRPGIVGIATDKNRSAESEAIYKAEWKKIMDALYSFPSIVIWVPFNEAWGQFKTEEIVNWTVAYDGSRLVNSASGGNFHPVGHILDLHNYPDPAMPDPALFGSKQVIVLGEFGGLGLPLEGHTWNAKDNWGYQNFSTRDELQTKYQSFIERLELLIANGLSAAVYTQTTDVEIEVNGLMTYDRKVVKIPAAKLHDLHQKLFNEALVKMKTDQH